MRRPGRTARLPLRRRIENWIRMADGEDCDATTAGPVADRLDRPSFSPPATPKCSRWRAGRLAPRATSGSSTGPGPELTKAARSASHQRRARAGKRANGKTIQAPLCTEVLLKAIQECAETNSLVQHS